MRSEIDQLMCDNHVDIIWVTGAGQNNPAMVYLTGGIEVTQADLFKRVGEPGVLFHSPIERDGAARSGFPLRSYAEFPLKNLIDEAAGNIHMVPILRTKKILETLGITSGQTAVYGLTEIGSGYNMLLQLTRAFPGLSFEISPAQDILARARATKDSQEIDRIRQVAEKTVRIVANIADFVSSQQVKNEVVYKKDGTPLTISDVKKRISFMLLEFGLQAQETIFAIGRDAGVPHNNGNPESSLKTGQTIVFDAFFQEAGGGYCYDFTRTWCLGHAADEVQRMHQHVQEVHTQVAKAIKCGTSFSLSQGLACEIFEELGYETIQSNPATQSGYVHGIGHGLGLKVHELPASNADVPENILKPGMVFTIEPGLYYPERGVGIRIEDTYYLDEDGNLKVFVEYPHDLVLPL